MFSYRAYLTLLALALAGGCWTSGCRAESDAAEVVPAAHQVPLLQLEMRRPGRPAGEVCGTKIVVTGNFALRAYVCYAELGTCSPWTLMLDRPAPRRELDLLLKLMTAKGLENLDASKMQAKCDAEKSSPAEAYPPQAPTEVLSVRYPHCTVPAVIVWRDLAVQAKTYQTVPELVALNEAVDEVVALAVNACPDDSPVRDLLKRP
jgi:hypothetical protein